MQVIEFSPDNFYDVFADASRSAARGDADADVSPETRHQVEYLARHLAALNTRWLVVEADYVDRYYMDEYAHYYSRCLVPPPNKCRRIHAFASSHALPDFVASYAEAIGQSEISCFEAQLNQAYLGFMVVRPVPTVPVGRTVLRPLNDDPARRFPTCATYTVHLAGLELQIDGLAFQQQDAAVAACATTALWTALQKVAKRDGFRSPTPSEITEAAVRHYVPAGRPFPAHGGLTLEQVSDALRQSCGDPVVLGMDHTQPASTFKALIQVYLNSQIPVVLLLGNPGEDAHAVTVVGYRHTDGHEELVTGGQFVRFDSLSFCEIYVHDDRLGPYSRAFLEIEKREVPSSNASAEILRFRISRDGDAKFDERSDVVAGVAPLYPKLRTTAQELLLCLVRHMPWMKREAKRLGAELSVSAHFDRAGSVLRSAAADGAGGDRFANFASEVVLSRYVGVTEMLLAGAPAVRWLWDTTDMVRKRDINSQLCGIISMNPNLNDNVETLAKLLAVTSG